ncbi:hypothetical protein ACPA9J_00830 [Pseudomonas aeruginosa]
MGGVVNIITKQAGAETRSNLGVYSNFPQHKAEGASERMKLRSQRAAHGRPQLPRLRQHRQDRLGRPGTSTPATNPTAHRQAG